MTGIMSKYRYPNVNLLGIALVAAGGALGAAARYVVSTLILRAASTSFPAGTFLVNLTGCIIFGVIIGAAEHRFVLSPEARVFLLVGVLGGFTTFSSYAFESVALMQDGQVAAAAFNIAGQVVAGLAGLWIAYAVAR
jgi:CrcB protein